MDLVVIATMHGKEAVLGPLVQRDMGFEWGLARGLDTDAFGTFTGEIPRAGSQLSAARAKAEAALRLHPEARYALASEGSFGPHPQVPRLPGGVELVYLLDRLGGALSGWDVAGDTNFAQAHVTHWAEALAFAEQARFPSHALVVARSAAPGDVLAKGVCDVAWLRTLLDDTFAKHGSAWLATDMRAHLNPTRMDAIARAGGELLAAWRARCPQCAAPGFVVKSRVRGLPCRACGEPTRQVKSEIRICGACRHLDTRHLDGVGEPQWCETCNL